MSVREPRSPEARACVRCETRPATPLSDRCRACRYYDRRSDGDVMEQVSVRLPRDLLAQLRADARARGETLSFIVRGRIARGGRV